MSIPNNSAFGNYGRPHHGGRAANTVMRPPSVDRNEKVVKAFDQKNIVNMLRAYATDFESQHDRVPNPLMNVVRNVTGATKKRMKLAILSRHTRSAADLLAHDVGKPVPTRKVTSSILRNGENKEGYIWRTPRDRDDLSTHMVIILRHTDISHDSLINYCKVIGRITDPNVLLFWSLVYLIAKQDTSEEGQNKILQSDADLESIVVCSTIYASAVLNWNRFDAFESAMLRYPLDTLEDSAFPLIGHFYYNYEKHVDPLHKGSDSYEKFLMRDKRFLFHACPYMIRTDKVNWDLIHAVNHLKDENDSLFKNVDLKSYKNWAIKTGKEDVVRQIEQIEQMY